MSEQTESLLSEILTPPVTLEKLAASGIFVSLPLGLPADINSVDWTIMLNGEILPDTFVREIYAPGDERGWAVVFKPRDDGMHTGETELIFGRWELIRGPHDFSRDRDKQKADSDVGESIIQGLQEAAASARDMLFTSMAR